MRYFRARVRHTSLPTSACPALMLSGCCAGSGKVPAYQGFCHQQFSWYLPSSEPLSYDITASLLVHRFRAFVCTHSVFEVTQSRVSCRRTCVDSVPASGQTSAQVCSIQLNDLSCELCMLPRLCITCSLRANGTRHEQFSRVFLNKLINSTC